MKHTISVLVENHSGVLSRISGLFSRRGFNIESLAVGPTQDPTISRITIIADGNEHTVEQIEKQLGKLVDVLDIKCLDEGEYVARELVLVNVRVSDVQRQAVISIANIFRANIVDVASDSLIIELTGNQSKLDAFIKLLEGYEILELARTGITGLSRGSDNVRYLD